MKITVRQAWLLCISKGLRSWKNQSAASLANSSVRIWCAEMSTLTLTSRTLSVSIAMTSDQASARARWKVPRLRKAAWQTNRAHKMPLSSPRRSPSHRSHLASSQSYRRSKQWMRLPCSKLKPKVTHRCWSSPRTALVSSKVTSLRVGKTLRARRSSMTSLIAKGTTVTNQTIAPSDEITL